MRRPWDVASSGLTPEAARKAVDEAVELFLATAAEHGTLKEVLEDAGCRRVSREWRSPAWLGIDVESRCLVFALHVPHSAFEMGRVPDDTCANNPNVVARAQAEESEETLSWAARPLPRQRQWFGIQGLDSF